MRTLLTSILACGLCLTGCALSRRDADLAVFSAAAPVGFAADVRYYSADWRKLDQRVSDKVRRLREASPDGSVSVLALSGGGAAGAFGAGALVGLSRRGERPEFQVVTGVSTGALIAPFAFLGPDWDRELTRAYAGEHTESLLRRTHWLTSLVRPGVYDNRALAAMVDRYVTPDLIRAVAHEAVRGRLLEVATTDLDKQETVIWDMGAIAMRGDESARELFRDVLLASASVPGVFRPVVLHVSDGATTYDEMHVDGATAVPFVGAPESMFYSSFELSGLDRGRIYVLINGQLASAPRTTPFRTMPVLSRSFTTATRHMTRIELASTAAFAQLQGMDLHFTAIPADYPEVDSLDFRPSTMQALFEYGERCAAQGRLWTTVGQAIAHADEAMARWQQSSSPGKSSVVQECPLDGSAELAPPQLPGATTARAGDTQAITLGRLQ